jgi:uncharacterized protein (TIGR00369 family)
MDPAQRRQQLLVLYERSPIKHTLGVALSYDESGRAVFDMPYRSSFDNAMGNTHGGILATLLDKAGWFTAAQQYGTWIATADLHVQLLAPADRQPLRAVGQLVRAGRRLAVATMEVRTGDGTLVAIGSGTYAVTTRPFSVTESGDA